jgi:hypothetical protein
MAASYHIPPFLGHTPIEPLHQERRRTTCNLAPTPVSAAVGVSPIPNSSSARYFPSTHRTLHGDLLRFWQQHGGMAVFGAPITEVMT